MNNLELYPYQKYGAEWLRARHLAILADQMGLGKTLQAISAIPKATAVIVVSPPGLILNWKREIQRAIEAGIIPQKEVIDINYRNWNWPTKNQIGIISYTRLPKPIEKNKFPVFAYSNPNCETIIIADEAHYVKNSKSQRTNAFRALASCVHRNKGRIWLLTGTPLLNRPPELWSLLQSLDYSAKQCFGSWESFCTTFGRKEKVRFFGRGSFMEITWGIPDESAYIKLKPYFLRRNRETVLPELPSKTITKYFITGNPKLDISDLELTNIDDNELLKRCVTSPIWATARRQLAAFKTAALLELVNEYEEAEEPVIIFSAHREPISAFQNRDGWGVVLGGDNMIARDKIIKDFQAGKLKGIAGTIGSLGTGHTLTRSNICIFVDQSPVPAENWQAEDRSLRIGQKKAVEIIHLLTNHKLDTRLEKILENKRKLIDIFDSAIETNEGV